MDKEQRLLGIADLTSRLGHSGVTVIEYNQPWSHMRSTYFEIGKSERVTDFVLSDEFLRDLPNTKEYQAAVESYAQAVAGRLRCGSPNLFYCASNRAITISIKWPIQVAVFDGMPKTWLLFTVTDEENGSVARCCVDSDRHLTYFGTTTFDDIRNSVSRIRKAIDKGALLFYPSLQAHPEPYQSVDKIPAKMPLIPSAAIEKFIAGKTYKLGFQIPDVPGEIFATDPWDAEYLGATKKDLARSAYILRARGLIELDMSQTFARPSDKLVTTGWPAALGSNPTVIAPQIFELSSLPKKEDLSADLKSQLGQGCGLALIFIDLDRFKEVNDTKGHAQGDVCLEGVVKTIGSALGKKGKVYRWGGDEFAITLPDFSTNEALATAERIRKAIEESKSGGDIAVTASIGVCGADLLPEATAETLLRAADDAMYTAKHTGKNRVAPWSPQAKSEVAPVPTA